MTYKIILDTDPGIDDAAAITIALNHPEIDIQLLTTVVGNVDIQKTTKNALKLVEFYNSNVAVAEGAQKPLIVDHKEATDVHGISGMDGYEFPEPTYKISDKHAVEALRDTLMAAEEPLTVIPVGALTNIALLFSQYPEVKAKIDRLIIMGGALYDGNRSSNTEFNMATDPHAAKMVFEAGVPIVMIGLDITHKAILSPENLALLADKGRAGVMLSQLFSHYKDQGSDEGTAMHDVSTMFYLLHPEKVKTVDYYIDIITEGPAIGATIADTRGVSGYAPNASVGLDIDVEFFNKWFVDTIASFEKGE